MTYDWNFNVIFNHKQAFVSGALVTLELAVLTIFFGTIIGFIFYLLKDSDNKIISEITRWIIEILRALPLLVFLIWLFYAVTPLLGIDLSAFWTAVLGLSLILGAFCSEIFRAGVNSISRGQIEAGKAIGLTKLQLLTRIIFPQALKVILPPLTGRYIETIKLTSLASVIAVNELLHQGNNLISITYRPLEVYTVVALIYLAIIIPMTFLLQKLEGKHVRG